MESLDDYNKRRGHGSQPDARRDGAASPNGIACPTCGKELFDSNPNETLMSDPPQKRVHCNECRYYGFRAV